MQSARGGTDCTGYGLQEATPRSHAAGMSGRWSEPLVGSSTGSGRSARSETPMIRFNRPALEGSELDYIAEAVSGGHTSSSGPFAHRASELLHERLGVEAVLLTTSCTDALEMSA